MGALLLTGAGETELIGAPELTGTAELTGAPELTGAAELTGAVVNPSPDGLLDAAGCVSVVAVLETAEGSVVGDRGGAV